MSRYDSDDDLHTMNFVRDNEHNHYTMIRANIIDLKENLSI
jgi:hypothetical protein